MAYSLYCRYTRVLPMLGSVCQAALRGSDASGHLQDLKNTLKEYITKSAECNKKLQDARMKNAFIIRVLKYKMAVMEAQIANLAELEQDLLNEMAK